MLNYNMDIDERSSWITATPGAFARSLPFYCTEVGEFYAGSDFFTERDEKEGYWLVYTIKGEGELNYRSEQIRLTAGCCYIVDCREYQYYRTAPTSTDWHHFWVHLNGNGIDGYIKQLALSSEPVLLDPQTTSDFFRILLLHARQNTTEDMMENSVQLHNILHSMFKALHSHLQLSDNRSDAIIGCAKYLRERYATKINLDEMAKNAHLSKFHFIRLFKKYMGTSPYDYLLHHRITKAKHKLCSTNLSIAEIAIKTGFSGESNFSSQFSRITGMSPLKFRKEHYNLKPMID